MARKLLSFHAVKRTAWQGTDTQSQDVIVKWGPIREMNPTLRGINRRGRLGKETNLDGLAQFHQVDADFIPGIVATQVAWNHGRIGDHRRWH